MAVPSASSQYHLGDSIGFGAFGVAYLGTHKTDQEHEVVIKKIYDTAAKEEDVKALKELKHDRILEIRDSYVDEMGTLYLVMEKADKSSLTKLLSSNSTPTVELNVWRFLSHLSSGLAYLHQRNILHQDLNPDNVMAVRAWSEVAKDYRTDWKLADFSLPTLLNQEVKERFYSHVRGSGQVYWAPEALNDPGLYGPPADIWSLGAVVSAFCNQGKHLFTNMHEVMEWTAGSSLPNSYSEDLKKLQGKMLAIDTESRATAKELLAECTPERQAIHLDAQPDEDEQSFIESISEVLPESSAEKEPAVLDIMRNDNQEIGGHTLTQELNSKIEMEQDTIDNKENIIQTASYPEENSKEEHKVNNQINEDFTPKKKERKKKKKLEHQLVEKNHELESSVLITDIDENKDKKRKKKKDKKDKDSKESKEKKHRKVTENNTNIPAVQESHSHEKVQLDKTDKIPMDMVNISPIEFPNGSIIKIPNGTVSNVSDISVDKVTDKKIDTQGKRIDGEMVSGISQNISLSRRSSIYDDTLSCATDTLTRRKKKRAPIPQLPTPIQGVVEPVMDKVETNQPQVVKRKKKKAPPPPDIQKPAEIHTTPLPNTQKPAENHTFPPLDIQKPAEILAIRPSDMQKSAEIPTIKEIDIPADIEKIPSPIPRKKYAEDKFEETTEIHPDLRMPPIPKERKKKKNKNKNKTDSFSDYKEGNVMQESITSFASEGSIDSGVDVIETPPTSECSQEFPNHSDDILRSEVILNDVDNSTHDSVEDTNEEHTDDTLQQLTQDNEIETPSDVGIEEIELDDTIYESPVGTENFDGENGTDLKSNDVESIVGDAIEVTADEKLMMSEDDEIISTDKDELTSEFIDDENKEIQSGIIYWEKTCKPLENIDDFSLDQVSTKLEDEDKLEVESREEFEEEIIDMSKSDDKLKMDHYHQGNVEQKNDFDINFFIKEEIQITQRENNQFNRYPSSDENTPRGLRNVLEESMNSGEYNTVQNNMIKKDIPKKTFVQLVTPVITLQTWGERSSKKVTVQNHQSESGTTFWEELHQKEENLLELNSSTKKPVDRSESRVRNVNVPIQTYKPIKREKSVKQEEKNITVQNHQSENGEFWERIHKDSENELELNSSPAKASSTKNVNVSIGTYKPIKSEMSGKKEEKKQLKAKDKMQKPSINSLETNNKQATYSRVNSTEEEENISNVKNTGNVFSNILRDFDEKRVKKISEMKNIEKPIIKPKPDLTQFNKKKQISNGFEEADNASKSNDVKVERKSRKENSVDKIREDSNDYLQKQNTFYLDAFPNQTRKTSYSLSGNTLPKVPRKTSTAPVVTHNWRPVNPQLNGISESKDKRPIKGQLNGISENQDRIKPYTSLSWRYNDNEKRKVSEASMSNSTIEKQQKGKILIEEKNNSEEVKQNGFPETKDMNNSSPTPAPRSSLSDSNKLQKENNEINNHLKVKNEPAPWDVFMESIQKGAKLKPVMTNDRSSPMLTRKLKKLQPVDIYDRESQQVALNKPLKNQPPSLTNHDPPKTFQDPHELSHRFNQASQRAVQPPQVPPPPQSLGSLHSSQSHPSASPPSPPLPPPVRTLKSSQSHPPTSLPSPVTDNGDLLKAIQNGKKLRPVSNIEKRVPQPDARSNFLSEIREGKKLNSVQCNDRSGPSLRTGKYS